ncbi:MAG: hypothetical protein ACC707_04690 [Thiohalomonadales bacterium]
MQRRRSQSSSRKTPHIGGELSSRSPTRNPIHNDPSKRPQAVALQDTAANDHYLQEFSTDLFQPSSSSLLQRLFLSYGAIIRRLIFLGVMAAVLGYFYPDSLATLISGVKKISVLIEDGVSESLRTTKGDTGKTGSTNLPGLPESNNKKSDEDPHDEKLNSILNQITSEISDADAKQKRKNQRQASSNNELNRAMREKFEHRPLGRVPVTISPHKKATSPPRSMRHTRQTSLPKTRPKTATIVSKIPEQDLDQIIRAYSKNYVMGDNSAIAKLFMVSKNVQQQRAVETLLKGNATLFDKSSQRWIEFQQLSWVHEANRAMGTGIIKSESMLQKGRRSVAANVFIELRRVSGVTKIARFDLSNEKTSLALSGPEQILSSRAASLLPSRLELQAMVTQFASAYERADIASMDSMFSRDIISNSSSGRAEVLKDYEDLFSSSRRREITISDLRWTFTKTRAKGVGEMKAEVVSNDGKVRIVKGKIQFVTKKIANMILITHLYHIEYSR